MPETPSRTVALRKMRGLLSGWIVVAGLGTPCFGQVSPADEAKSPAQEPLPAGTAQETAQESEVTDPSRLNFVTPATWEEYRSAFYGDEEDLGDDQSLSVDDGSLLSEAGIETPAPTGNVKSRKELEAIFGDQLDVLESQIERLGSSDFADRERASTELLDAGFEIVPVLRRAVVVTSDAEMKLRITQLLIRLEDQYREAMETAFLAGTGADLPGWNVARQLLGDSEWIRREYVQMHREVPELLSALDGDTDVRKRTLERVLNTPNPDLMGAMGPDSRAALTAILLATADPEFLPNVAVESHLLNHLRRPQGQRLLREGVTREYGSRLFGNFVMKTGKVYRSQWLFHGSDRNLPATSLLAAQTLAELNTPMELVSAMAASVRFQAVDQIDSIAKYLEDDRGLGANRMREGVLFDIRVSDVAMAAIGSLLGKQTDEIGFSQNANYPNVGLHLDRLAMPVVSDAKTTLQRETIRENVDALLKSHRPAADAGSPDSSP